MSKQVSLVTMVLVAVVVSVVVSAISAGVASKLTANAIVNGSYISSDACNADGICEVNIVKGPGSLLDQFGRLTVTRAFINQAGQATGGLPVGPIKNFSCLTTSNEIVPCSIPTVPTSLDIPTTNSIILSSAYSKQVVQLTAWVSDGFVNFSLMYANETNQFKGLGQHDDKRLVTSRLSTINLDKNTEWFVASRSNGVSSESYVLSIDHISKESGDANTTVISSVAKGSTKRLKFTLRPGESSDSETLGNITLTVKSINANAGTVNMTISSIFGEDDKVFFDRLYDTSGAYILLPLSGDIPTLRYFPIYYTHKPGVGTIYDAYVFEYDVKVRTIANDLVYIGYGSNRFTMTSPNGNVWRCGPQDNGAWSCTSGLGKRP
jgi:hypothetical protein